MRWGEPLTAIIDGLAFARVAEDHTQAIFTVGDLGEVTGDQITHCR